MKKALFPTLLSTLVSLMAFARLSSIQTTMACFLLLLSTVSCNKSDSSSTVNPTPAPVALTFLQRIAAKAGTLDPNFAGYTKSADSKNVNASLLTETVVKTFETEASGLIKTTVPGEIVYNGALGWGFPTAVGLYQGYLRVRFVQPTAAGAPDVDLYYSKP